MSVVSFCMHAKCLRFCCTARLHGVYRGPPGTGREYLVVSSESLGGVNLNAVKFDDNHSCTVRTIGTMAAVYSSSTICTPCHICRALPFSL